MLGEKVRPARRAQVGAIFVLFFVLGVVTAGLGASLPGLRRTYDLGEQGGGWLVSAYSLGALTAILTCGIGRFPQRSALRVLPAVFALGALGMGVAGSWVWFCAATVVAGTGYGGLVLYLNSLVARGFGERSFLMLSLVNAVFGVGAILGPLAVSFAGVHLFLAAGLLTLTSVGIGTLPAAPSATTGPGRLHGARPQIILAFLGLGFLYAGLETGTGAWAATHLDWTGHSASDAARLSALFWVGLATGRFVISPLVGARAPRDLVRVALLAAAVSLLIATQPDTAPFAYAACGLALAPVFPATIQWIAQNVEDNHTANAMLLTATLAGSVVLPALVGALTRPATPATIPLTIACLAVLAIGTAHLLSRATR
jgi:FHS family glucose/mannose:H+ symporter-like MFS transporter